MRVAVVDGVLVVSAAALLRIDIVAVGLAGRRTVVGCATGRGAGIAAWGAGAGIVVRGAGAGAPVIVGAGAWVG